MIEMTCEPGSRIHLRFPLTEAATATTSPGETAMSAPEPGLIVAPLTPFTADLAVDEPALARQLDYIIKDCRATMIVAAGSGWSQSTFNVQSRNRPPLYRIAFNIAVLVITVQAAGRVYQRLGGDPLGDAMGQILSRQTHRRLRQRD